MPLTGATTSKIRAAATPTDTDGRCDLVSGAGRDAPPDRPRRTTLATRLLPIIAPTPKSLETRTFAPIAIKLRDVSYDSCTIFANNQVRSMRSPRLSRHRWGSHG